MGVEHFTNNLDTTGLSTEAKQDAIKGVLDNIYTAVDELEIKLDAIEITADSIELQTDELEAKLEDVKTKLDTLNATDFATETTQATLLTEAKFDTKTGEVSATPTANTVLGRLKDIHDSLQAIDLDTEDLATETTLAAVLAAVDGIEGKLDTLIAVDYATSAKQDSIITELQDIEADVEGTNTLLTTIDAVLDSILLAVDGLEGNTDEIETKLEELKTKLDTLNAVDFATESTLNTLLTQANFDLKIGEVSATPTTNTVLARLKDIHDELSAINLDTEDLATETTLSSVLAAVDGVETKLDSLIAKDYATETTLAAFKTQNSLDLQAIEDNQTDGTQKTQIVDSTGDVADVVPSIVDGLADGKSLRTAGHNYVWNGAEWWRMKDVANGDNLTSGLPAAGIYGFDGAGWDRIKTAEAAHGGSGTGILAGGMFLYDTVSNNYRRVQSTRSEGDANTLAYSPAAGMFGFNGTTWDRLRSSIAHGLEVDVTRLKINGSEVSETNPLFIRESVSRLEIPGLSFSQTLTASQTYTTDWVDTSATNWLDIVVGIEATGIATATIEVTNAPDPNTTPPAADDITRALTTTVAGPSAGGISTPSFGLPAQCIWTRLKVTDLSGGQDIDVTVFDHDTPPTGAQVPFATTLTKEFRSPITQAVIRGELNDEDGVGTGNFDTVPLSSTGSLQVADVPDTIAENTFEISGSLPSGSVPTFDPIGPIVASNVIDTGWINVSQWDYQFFHGMFNVDGVKVFLMDASDDQGNNSITSDFSIPTAVSSSTGSINVGAPFFQDYFRIVIINDTGSSATSWAYRSIGLHHTIGQVVQPLDQPILDFIPAPITQSINKGESPDGVFNAVKVQGRHGANSTTTPLAGNVTFVGSWFEWQTSHVGLQVEVNSDVSGTLKYEFSTKANPAEGVDTDVDYDVIQEYDPAESPGVLRRTTPLQSRWVRVKYINGPAAQSVFSLDSSFLTQAPPLVGEPLSAKPKGDFLAGLIKGVDYGKDEFGNYSHIERTGTAKNVHLSSVSDGVQIDIAALSNWRTSQANVSPTSAVQLAGSGLGGRRTVAIKNSGTNDSDIYIGTSSVVTVSTGFPISQGETVEIDLDDGAQIWAIAGTVSGSTNVQTLNPTAVNTNNGASTPTNGFTSDNTYAVLNDQGDSVVYDMGDLTLTLDEISKVEIGFEGRKSPSSPATETVAFVDEVNQLAGDVGSITSPTVTSNSEHFYIVSVTRRNTSAAVSSITNTMGITSWTLIEDITNPGDFRTSVYKADSAPTQNGTVTVNFSNTATNATMFVSRYSGVNLASPVENSESIIGDAAASYSDSIIGTDKGMLVTFVGCRQRAHTAGSGATEQNEIFTGTGSNGARQALNTFSITATGSNNYSGTFAGNAEHATVALTLSPAFSTDPQITLSYEVNGEGQGATTLSQSLSLTTDSVFRVDITPDRAWDVANIDATKLTIEATVLGNADAEIDHVFIEVTEASTGTTQRVSVLEVA